VKQPAEFVDGDVDQPIRACSGDRGGDGEEGVGGDDQGRPAVPRFPAAVLILVQTQAGFRGLKRFLDAPATAGDGDELVQGNEFG
jgi:hypothetical protein